MQSRKRTILLSGTLFALVSLAEAEVLPAGTNLEVRLAAASGSRSSHAGDPVTAKLIAPAFQQGRLVLPQGVTLGGVIERVDRLGFGLKYRIASIKYHFESVQFPDGRVFPLLARVREVETAKERVSESGVIGGIYPAANLSSGTSFLVAALIAEPAIAVPVLAVKFLIARSPDPEIYFPPGTELVLEVTADAALPSPRSETLPSVTQEETRRIGRLLDSLPQQRTDRGQDRPSDLINILLLGSHEQIATAFHAAGWSGEQKHSALALYRMYHCTVQRIGYGMAPMTRLKLNGALPDLAYQKSLNTLSKRHHIRVWNQEHSGAWLGAATEDVGYAVRRMHLTHATNPEIDNERAKVVNDLLYTGCIDAASLVPRESLKQSGGDGSSITTDGAIAVLRLNDCPSERLAGSLAAKNEPRPPSRAVQAVRAVGVDIARSNPIALGYNGMKSLSKDSSLPLETMHSSVSSSPETAESSETPMRYKWRRSTVIDTGVGPPLNSRNQLPSLKPALKLN